MPGLLVLSRHGQSEWNAKNLFTGKKDPSLTSVGEKEAFYAGTILKETHNIIFDFAFSSVLKRAIDTCSLMLKAMNQESIPLIKNGSLNERDYGALTGQNKEEAALKYGSEKIQQWRRSYDIAP
jgi:2,3-bisphosphoglycerate-dependent phosphoglycerate mutase